MFKTQNMKNSLICNDLASGKIRVEIVVRKYSAKSLREIRGMVPFGYISLVLARSFHLC